MQTMSKLDRQQILGCGDGPIAESFPRENPQALAIDRIWGMKMREDTFL